VGGACAAAASRAFSTEQQVRKLRLKGVVARAFKRSAPPKMPQKATEHYVKVLRSHGGAAAHQVVQASRREREAMRRAETFALTSEEKTKLLWRYVPDEAEAVSTLRKSSHKWLWRFMKKRDWKRFDACLEQLHTRQLRFDEITYNLAIFGILLHPRREDEAVREVFSQMVEANRFHPALLRLQGGFVESYFELREVDAAPNPWNLLKVAKTFWQISVNFKRQRVKDTRRRLAEAAALERQRLALEHAAAGDDESAGAAGAAAQTPLPSLLGYGGGGAGAAGESDEEFSDGETRNKPRVKFPAQRPRQVKGVFKGSGVPNRRKHRWKH